MATLLENLELDEVSLVDRPANQEAKIALFKRDTSGEEMTEDTIKMSDDMKQKLKPYLDKGMTEEEAMKAYDADMMKKADEEIETLKADLDRARKENERLTKALIDNGFVIAEEEISKKQEVEMIEVAGEMVAKCDIPAPVLKALEAAAIEKADIELTKRAEEALPHFDVAVAKSLVKSFADDEKIMEALKAADKAFEAAMQEFGKSDVNGDFATSAEKLDAMVKAYMAEKNMKPSEFAKAYAAVAKTQEGKALITKSYKGE